LTERILSAIGVGLDEDVCEVYNFLATNYEPGDELFFFGFSRGAFTARAAAGLVCRVGLCETYMLWRFWEVYAVYKTLGPNERIGDTVWVKSWDSGSEDYFSLDVRGKIVRIKKGYGSERFTSRFAKKVKVKVVGVWDTVGAIGIPNNIIWGCQQCQSEIRLPRHSTQCQGCLGVPYRERIPRASAGRASCVSSAHSLETIRQIRWQLGPGQGDRSSLGADSPYCTKDCL